MFDNDNYGMTIQRKDLHGSTEFGLWLRNQEQIDSNKGYICSNLDYCWHNNRNGHWLLIEEKRHNSSIKPWQKAMFEFIDKACKSDKNYRGFHTLVFENTSPDDGHVWLDGVLTTKVELIDFLKDV